MKRYLTWIALGALVVVVAVAVVGLGPQSDPAVQGSGNTGIPAQDGTLVAAGERLYQESCASCHGNDLRGTATGPSHLSIVYEPNHHGDAAFQLAVRNGVRQHHWPFGDMEPIPGLTDDDVGSIIAYVRERQRINGFEPYPPAP